MIKTVLKIDGMACGMCESHINDVVRKNEKIKSVKSSFKKGETEIISENNLDINKLKEEIGKTGYKVISYTEEEYVKKGLFHF